MPKHFPLTTLILSLGIALLLAGLFFDTGAATPAAQDATPTPDRLAEPTLPASPSQADLGAQVYWLSCLPCHGDRGQGLTDEFRAAYPPEEQYCWERGCHGENPYESGFTIPKTIPAVIGPQTLTKFADGAQLQAYIRAAMPFWDPGSLSEEDAWKVTAYLLRSNGLWYDTGELNAENASQVKIQQSTPASTVAPEADPGSNGLSGIVVVSVLALFVLLVVVIFLVVRLNRSDREKSHDQ